MDARGRIDRAYVWAVARRAHNRPHDRDPPELEAEARRAVLRPRHVSATAPVTPSRIAIARLRDCVDRASKQLFFKVAERSREIRFPMGIGFRQRNSAG